MVAPGGTAIPGRPVSRTETKITSQPNSVTTISTTDPTGSILEVFKFSKPPYAYVVLTSALTTLPIVRAGAAVGAAETRDGGVSEPPAAEAGTRHAEGQLGSTDTGTETTTGGLRRLMTITRFTFGRWRI